MVNKAELCLALGCSRPTLDALLQRHGGAFPVIRHGTHGRGYGFDVDDVRDFLREAEEERQQRATIAHEAEVRRSMLPLDELFADRNTYLKPGQRFSVARAQALERRMQRESGFLVETAEVRRVLADAGGKLRATLHDCVQQAGADAALPPATLSRLTAAVDEALRVHAEACELFAAGVDTIGVGRAA